MQHMCDPSGGLDSSNFGKPMPVIGLYVAGASLACLVLMALDMITSFKDKMYWIKCKFFKLNAVTITLLSIAVKLPADVNTSMPGAQHQLTKVTGIVILCVSMGFFTPSLGAMDAQEMWPNMVALAILVVTVAVDVGIQIGTGAIFAFIPEHILLLCMMLLSLEKLCHEIWSETADVKFVASSSEGDLKRQILSSSQQAIDPQARMEGYKSILPKVWKVLYATNVQSVMINGHPGNFMVGFLSVASVVILLEIEVRHLLLPFKARTGPSSIFCKGESDYGWSIPLVLISQSLVVLLASIVICIRLFFSSAYLGFYKSYQPANLFKRINNGKNIEMPPQFSRLLYHSNNEPCMKFPTSIAQLTLILFMAATLFIPFIILYLVGLVLAAFNHFICTCKSQTIEEWANQISEGSFRDNNIKNMVDAWFQRGRRWSTTHLLQLLTDHHGVVETTDWSTDPIWCLFQDHIHKFQGSCYFFLTALIHITISLSTNSNESELIKLVGAVKEAERALLFMDKCILPTSNTIKVGTKAGQLMWESMKYNWPGGVGTGTSMATDPDKVLDGAVEVMEATAFTVHNGLLRYSSHVSATSVCRRHVDHLLEGIRDNILKNSAQGAPNQVLEWISARMLYIIVYCFSVILDEKHVFKMQMEEVKEAAQLLGLMQGLDQQLFPILQQIYSRASVSEWSQDTYLAHAASTWFNR